MTQRNGEQSEERTLPGALDGSIEPEDQTLDTRAHEERAADTPAAGREAKARPAKRTPRKRATQQAKPTDEKAERGAIIQMPERAVATDERSIDETGLQELAAQGFTPDEAQRLLYISDRLATSREAREAEATLRRLRFTRWLIEHGMLDEFSA
jgi:hypothetical protein